MLLQPRLYRGWKRPTYTARSSGSGMHHCLPLHPADQLRLLDHTLVWEAQRTLRWHPMHSQPSQQGQRRTPGPKLPSSARSMACDWADGRSSIGQRSMLHWVWWRCASIGLLSKWGVRLSGQSYCV